MKTDDRDLWFKQKTYGWGWTPANWKGWLVILGYVALTLAYPLTHKGIQNFSIPLFLFITLALTVSMIWLCYLKGEKPEWRWGKRE
jgi:uncharacterized membrane protein YhaH (DUF805 family)